MGVILRPKRRVSDGTTGRWGITHRSKPLRINWTNIIQQILEINHTRAHAKHVNFVDNKIQHNNFFSFTRLTTDCHLNNRHRLISLRDVFTVNKTWTKVTANTFARLMLEKVLIGWTTAVLFVAYQ